MLVIELSKSIKHVVADEPAVTIKYYSERQKKCCHVDVLNVLKRSEGRREDDRSARVA
jgi:hypothetical protein